MSIPPILVVSCDAYADLWDPFFALFRRAWPHCESPMFLGTNYKHYQDPSVTVIAVGEDRSWAENVRVMLDRIHAERVILLLEDFLFTRSVDGARVAILAELAVKENLHCLRLTPKLAPTKRLLNDEKVGELRPGDAWRVSTQAAIWKVDTLRELLRPGMTAWNFEFDGSATAAERFPDKFWGTYDEVLPYVNGVERGKWLAKGLSLCREAGVAVTLGNRQRTPRRTEAARFIRAHLHRYGMLLGGNAYRRVMSARVSRWVRV
jgi:hypothetical protein